MHLEIKTIDKKTIFVDIEETKLVSDLKNELHKLLDYDLPPESQRLIYSGEILKSEASLTSYNLDEKKALILMELKDLEKITINTGEKGLENDAKNNNSPLKFKHEKLVENIANMGFPKADVRRALEASFDNAIQAIEFLIVGGTPENPSTPESGTDFNTTTDSDVSPIEFFRTDPAFRRLKSHIMQDHMLLNSGIRRVGEVNSEVLRYIKENHVDFLTMLCESSDDEKDGVNK